MKQRTQALGKSALPKATQGSTLPIGHLENVPTEQCAAIHSDQFVDLQDAEHGVIRAPACGCLHGFGFGWEACALDELTRNKIRVELRDLDEPRNRRGALDSATRGGSRL